MGHYGKHKENEINGTKYYQTNKLSTIHSAYRQNYYNNNGFNKSLIYKNYYNNNSNNSRISYNSEQNYDYEPFSNEILMSTLKKYTTNNSNNNNSWRNNREINVSDNSIKSSFNVTKGFLTQNALASGHIINNNDLQPLSSRFSNGRSPLTASQRRTDFNSNNYYNNSNYFNTTVSVPYSLTTNNKASIQRLYMQDYNKNRRSQQQFNKHNRSKVITNNELSSRTSLSNTIIDSNLQKSDQQISEFNFVEIEFPLLANEKKRHYELSTNEQQPCKKMATGLTNDDKESSTTSKTSLISVENTTKTKEKLKKIQFSAVVAGTYNRDQNRKLSIEIIPEHVSINIKANADFDAPNIIVSEKCSYAQTLKKSNR